ncbi:MAG: molybdenum cofactor biosynthesis protein MoaE [Verrucomicrobiota bacterium JB022]|nr:molybdenum cofactor biosynthesis protein MoaE [Verrucomicrobiota bacterium JB022]
MACFELSEKPVDVATWRARLEDPAAGAIATFEGLVRDHHQGRAVDRLSYSAYAPLAIKEGEKILTEARARFPLAAAYAVHRIGDLAIGDCAVWVGVSSGHRQEAFAACSWIIDAIKERVPVWKEEFYADGSVEWVDPTAPRPAGR